MNEMTKTAVFAGVALLIALIALFAGPLASRAPVAADERGNLLFPDFDDPGNAVSLEIVSFNEKTKKSETFVVAKGETGWTIPSHANYPADAEGQLGKAVAALSGLKILSEPTKDDGSGSNDGPDRQTQNDFGVVDPDSAKPSDKGVGMRATLKDKADKKLASLIIGKEVPGQTGLRYVCRTGENQVYVTKVDTGELTTEFQKWIEEDLLKLSTWDIKQISIDDYAVTILNMQPLQDQKGRMTLAYDDSDDKKWKFIDDLDFDDEKGFVPRTMAEDEELDTGKLDDLKRAMGDLEIVDVLRKPDGFSKSLKDPSAGGLGPEAQLSLQSCGFYVVSFRDGDKIHSDLLSNKGEIRVTMKDGVEYLLRFGEVAGLGSKNESDEKKDGTDDAGNDENGSGVDRYLFVMAQFNPDAIPLPEYEELPEEMPQPPPDGTTPDPGKTDPAPPAGDPADPMPPAGDPADPMPPTGDPADPAPPADAPIDPVSPMGDPADPTPPAGAPAETEDDPPAGAEGEAGDPGADAGAADPGTDVGTGADDAADAKSELEAERKRIETENQRKRDEYNEKLEKGRQHTRELNARFADWYYIISDDVYQKIHLSREQIVKKKEKEKEEDEGKGDDHTGGGVTDPAETGTIDEFDKLKTEGPDAGE